MNRKIIIFLTNIFTYILIISILSIYNFVNDVIFVVGFATIMISSLLSLLKVNLEKFKFFIWINLTFFFLIHLY